jgi:hypothetical protein
MISWVWHGVKNKLKTTGAALERNQKKISIKADSAVNFVG